MTNSMFNFGRIFTKKNAITFDLSEIEKNKKIQQVKFCYASNADIKMSKIARKKTFFPKNVSIKL